MAKPIDSDPDVIRRRRMNNAKRDQWANADLSRFTEDDLDVLLNRTQMRDLVGIDVAGYCVPWSALDDEGNRVTRLRDALAVIRSDVAPSRNGAAA